MRTVDGQGEMGMCRSRASGFKQMTSTGTDQGGVTPIDSTVQTVTTVSQ